MFVKKPFISLVIFLFSASLMADTSESYVGLSPQERQTYGFNLLGLEVNTFNGNLLAGAPLFFIPGRGLPLECSLFYNSDHRKATSPFGKGWSFSYNIRYQRHSNGDITIVWGSGRQDRFTLNVDAGPLLTPPTGVYMTLSDMSQQVVLRNKYGLAFHFDNDLHRKLTKIVDPNGNRLSLVYDVHARLKQLIDASNRKLELVYNSQDYLREIRDLTGHRVYSFDMDGNGRLTQITDPMGHARQYAYNTEHLLTGITDKLGNTTTISYVTPGHDAQTRLPHTISKGVLSASFSFDRSLRKLTMSDPRHESWMFAYDAMNRLTSINDPDNKTVLFTWDDSYNLTSHTNRNGHTNSFSYDPLGNQLTHQDPLGEMRTWTYDLTHCRTKSYTDRNSHLWDYEYDPFGNLIEITDPLGHATTIVHDAAGQASSSTNPEGHTTHYSWDMYGNMHTITTPLGNLRTHTHDALSREVMVVDENGNATNFAYDDLNRRISRTNQNGQVFSVTYDAENQTTSETHERGAVTNYFYDALGRRTSTQDPLGNTISYSYDPGGNITGITDKLGNSHTFAYDELGRMISRTAPLGNTWIFGYDCEGNQTSRLDPKGQMITRFFDDRGYLIKRVLPDGSETNYSYDPNGNLLAASRPAATFGSGTVQASTISRTYDALNRKVSETDVELGMTISAIYNPDGTLKSTTWPDGQVQTFLYNADNRQTQSTFTDQAFSGSQVFNFAHDAAGRLTQLARPNGPITEYAYDRINRIVAHETRDASRTLRQTFSYSDDQMIEAWEDDPSSTQFKGVPNITYHFDLIDRIIRSTRSGAMPNYDLENTFDANGNRTASTGTTPFFPTSPWCSTYNANGEQVFEKGEDFNGPYTRTNRFDANGNLIEKDGTGIDDVTFGYNVFNQVVMANHAALGIQTFGFDALNRLNCINVANPASGEDGVQRFFYNLADRISLILDKTGQTRELRAYDLAVLNDRDADFSDESAFVTDFFGRNSAIGRDNTVGRDKPVGRGLLEPLADYYLRFNVRLPDDPPSDPEIPTSARAAYQISLTMDQDGSDEDEHIYAAPITFTDDALASDHRKGLGGLSKPPKDDSLFDYPGHLGNAPFPRPPRFPPMGFPQQPGGTMIRLVNTTLFFPLQDAFGNAIGSLNGPLSGLLRQIYDLLRRIIVFGNPDPLGALGKTIYRARINALLNTAGVLRDNYTTFRRNQPFDPTERHNNPFANGRPQFRDVPNSFLIFNTDF